MTILSIDPGPLESAWALWDGQQLKAGKNTNLALIEALAALPGFQAASACVIEEVCCYGRPVGREVLQTVRWSGRFEQAYDPAKVSYLPRLRVSQHICQHPRAKDSHIRQALIDRFGKPGTKRTPGLLYGVSGDMWLAVALAVTWLDLASDVIEPHASGLAGEI